MKKYNYKYIIGFVIGLSLIGGVVYAAINYSANVFFYDKTRSTLNSTNVQAAIDELATKYANLTTCPSDKICLQKKSTLALGDYISYTPAKTSYTTDTSKTGYTSTQTINPSELNLWRVLSINGDGTIDIISENVSSTSVYFKGLEGYKNLGYLNVLASQYETSGVTVGSRHFGYSNQTEYITSDTYFVNPAPWTCTTGGTCTPDPDDYEAYGGGDTGYLDDFNLVNTVLGTSIATRVGTTTAAVYWMPSRYYWYSSATNYRWIARVVNTSGSGGGSSTNYLYRYYSSSFSTKSLSGALRPIVRLKSGLSYSGIGNKDYPMEIQ